MFSRVLSRRRCSKPGRIWLATRRRSRNMKSCSRKRYEYNKIGYSCQLSHFLPEMPHRCILGPTRTITSQYRATRPSLRTTEATLIKSACQFQVGIKGRRNQARNRVAHQREDSRGDWVTSWVGQKSRLGDAYELQRRWPAGWIMIHSDYIANNNYDINQFSFRLRCLLYLRVVAVDLLLFDRSLWFYGLLVSLLLNSSEPISSELALLISYSSSLMKLSWF